MKKPQRHIALIALVAIFVIGLVSAPGANAELGITSYFKQPVAHSCCSPDFGGPGFLGRVHGVAVNHTGAGGAGAGDIYMVDELSVPFGETRFRIQQFSASGEFVREWDIPTETGGPEIAVDQSSGDVYVGPQNSTIGVYSATGTLLRRFGYDAVLTGPGDSSINEQQQLTIIASDGVYTLSCCELSFNTSPLTTVPLDYNAPANDADAGTPGVVDSVEEAVNQIGAVSGVGGEISVTGGPSGPADPGPYTYTLTYGGTLAGDDFVSWNVDTANLIGNTMVGRTETLVEGSGLVEVCVPADGDVCNEPRFRGSDPYRSNSLNTEARERPVQGAIGSGKVTVAPSGAPNAGNLLLADSGFDRVSEYRPTGDFVRSFGWDVNSHGPNDSAIDEVQQLTVDATGGKFSLTFPDQQVSQDGGTSPGPTTGAFGTGEVALGSNQIVKVDTTNGEFEVGQTLVAIGIPTGTTITAVGPHTLTLSAAATSGASVSRSLVANDIPYDATPGQIEAALESLPSIGGFGGTVDVTGSDGGPFTIEFGGTLGGDQLISLGVSSGGLTGGGQTATVATLADGGAFENCIDAAGDSCKIGEWDGTEPGRLTTTRSAGLNGIAEDSSGAIYVSGGPGGLVGPAQLRVQKFTPSGSTVTPSIFGSPERQSIKVSATAGQFRLTFAERNGTSGEGDLHSGSPTIDNVITDTGEFAVGQPISAGGITPGTTIAGIAPGVITLSQPAFLDRTGADLTSNRLWETGDLDHNATPGEVETALNGLGAISANGGSVSVTGGPGDETGTSPYVVAFDGVTFYGYDIPTELLADNGTAPLSGGSGPGANQALAETVQEGQPNGYDVSTSPVGVVVDEADNVYVSKHFPAGVATCPNGSPSPSETRIQQFETDGTVARTSAPCYGLPTLNTLSGLPALAIDPVSGEPYVALQETLPLFGFGAFAFIFGELGPQPDLTLEEPSDVSPTGATVSGTIDPNGPASAAGHPNPAGATYEVEYRVQGDADWTTYAPPTAVGFGDTAVPFNVGISGLTPKTPYEVRVTLSKLGLLDVVGDVQTFTTAAAPPTIDSFTSSNVTASSADLSAQINPLGTETTYHFEYGPTPCSANPCESTPETAIGDSLGAVSVHDHIEGLDPLVYYFRVVATNAEGTVASNDQTFNFYPEPCPNAAVRQQTGSGKLPDCRAYELVSPENAGTASLASGGPNSPYAVSPSRLSFYGFLGTIPRTGNPPNVFGDHYVASRTSTGWKTSYVGIPSNVVMTSGGPPNRGPVNPPWPSIMADREQDRFLTWNQGHNRLGCCGDRGSMAPYVWGAQGNSLGRWPTNLSEIPDGDADLVRGGFTGDVMPSDDFSHYFFSSANVAFTPDGKTTENGSVYDNDTESGSVDVVSTAPGGGDIPEEPGDETDDYMTMPGVSVDGSRILIGAAGTGVCGDEDCGDAPTYCSGTLLTLSSGRCPTLPRHLYMRVDDAVTYDVSRGHLVDFVGMTNEGSVVYFTSAEQVTADDTDTSVDLYRWREADDSVIRVSAGEGTIGDNDNCNASWVEKCGVGMVRVEFELFSEQINVGIGFLTPPTDNRVAAESGDVYFYSPEQFVGSRGIPGRRNLYVFREGELRYVATLDADKPLQRIQVSPDGRHAAFVTDSRLTTYDNAGFRMMYAYDPLGGGITCVSCLPTGEPPANHTWGSASGIFMSNDGRTFFSTRDALVLDDTNGIIDVYEYTDGRAQLISSGTASVEQGSIARVGLVGVSANGADVYFMTTRKLVAEDKNGEYIRFYDARTNGGFPVAAQVAPCEAADECHGPASTEAVSPRVSSSAPLASSGNARVDRCATKARRLRGQARLARALRNRVRQVARRAGTSRAKRRRVTLLRKRMRSTVARTKRTRAKVRRCRAAQRGSR